jgi:hypothetical protein
MPKNSETIALTAAPLEARREGIENPPNYRAFYNAILNGQLAAVQINGRYQIRLADALSFAKAARRGKAERVAA